MRMMFALASGLACSLATVALALPNEPDASGVRRGVVRWTDGREGSACVVTSDVPALPRELQHTIARIPAEVYRLDLDTGLEVAPFEDRGASNNRINIVTVGDGYLSTQQASYNSHVTNATNQLFSYEPFKTYKNYFQVFRVNVVSSVQGVSNDPTQGIMRATPLRMSYWCGGTERLLCVDVSACYSYAANAPQPFDQILAVANSQKYGGAGYPSSNVGTYAGGNGSAPLIAIHELGHSLGDLADEYDYGGSTTYLGGEPSDANSSKLTAAQMASQQRKWFRWLSESRSGFDSPVGTYEGSSYSQLGIYRPSPNSMMRALGPNFNLPSAEQLIKSIYNVVKPIDGPPSPTTETVLGPASSVSLTLMPTVNNPLSVQWLLDGEPIPGATDASFNVESLNLRKGSSTLAVRVIDTTTMVRDEAFRGSRMMQTLTWSMPVAACLPDLDGDRSVDDTDFVGFAEMYNVLLCSAVAPAECAADFNEDGLVDDADFVVFAAAYNALMCP
ncbi:MAG TPA: M64 family metallopeptidase [Phycisphaerales bacterium]